MNHQPAPGPLHSLARSRQRLRFRTLRYPTSLPLRHAVALFSAGVLALAPVSVSGFPQPPGASNTTKAATTPTATAAPAPPAERQVPEKLAFANGLLRSKRYVLAIEEYETFLKTAPPGLDATDALFGLANARLFLGQFREARKHFQDFLVMAPTHPNMATARYRVGELAFFVGDTAAAATELQKFVKEHPEHANAGVAYRYLGDIAWRNNALRDARTAYEQAIALSEKPQDARVLQPAQFGLGRTLAALGAFDEGLKILGDLADDGGEWTIKARHQQGKIHAAAGRPEEAETLFASLETAAADHPLLWDIRFDHAEVLRTLNRRPEAEAILKDLAKDSTQARAPRAAYEWGQVLAEQNRWENAFQIWDAGYQQHQAHPQYGPALLFRSAEAARTLGRRDDARQRYLKMLETAPKFGWAPDALVKAAELALESKDLVNARRLSASLAARYPKNPLIPEAHLIEGRAALAAGQAADAVTILQSLLKDDNPRPNLAYSAKYYLAIAQRDQGATPQALQALEAVANDPTNPYALQAWHELGATHYQQKSYPRAIEAFQHALETKPAASPAGAGKPTNPAVAETPRDTSTTLAYLCLSYAAIDSWAEAENVLKLLAEKAPQSYNLAVVRVYLGERASKQEQWPRAGNFFTPVADNDQSPQALRSRALVGLGWVLLRTNKADLAAKRFAAVVERDPKSPYAAEAALARGQALEAAGDTPAALTAYEQAATQFGGTAPTNPNTSTDARFARGRLLARQGRHAEAVTELKSVLESADATPNPASPERRAEILAELGWTYWDVGDTASAQSVFQQILERHAASPRAADARLTLAEIAFQAQDHARVVSLLAPLVSEPPAVTADLKPLVIQSALFRLGRSQFEKGDWDAAIALFTRLHDKYPEGPYFRESHYWHGETAYHANRPPVAAAQFRLVIPQLEAIPAATRSPADEQLLVNARIREVQLAVADQQWDEALKRATAVAAQHPQLTAENTPLLPELDFARARALQGLARFDEARTAYQAVIDRKDQVELAARAQFMRGETYFHQKNYPPALREFLKVEILYELPHWQALALLEAGKVYEQLGEWDKAVETYSNLMDQFPNEPAVRDAVKRRDLARNHAPSNGSPPRATNLTAKPDAAAAPPGQTAGAAPNPDSSRPR